MIKEVIPPEHIGDGLYMVDDGDCVAIAVNHHENKVAYIDIEDIDKVISYLQKKKENDKDRFSQDNCCNSTRYI